MVKAVTEIRYPRQRDGVLGALEALADVEYQRRVWLNSREFDDLRQNVHILFDDSVVLPDPVATRTVGAVVYPNEVEALRRLGQSLDGLLSRLGRAPDKDYITDPEWHDVVAAASRALAIMRSS